jgi:hypothetical protein
MDYEYLKSDTKRIEKKLEELNQKYDDIEHKKELNKIEERCKEIISIADDDLKAEIWADIYKDVFEIEKKSYKKQKSEKKEKKDK